MSSGVPVVSTPMLLAERLSIRVVLLHSVCTMVSLPWRAGDKITRTYESQATNTEVNLLPIKTLRARLRVYKTGKKTQEYRALLRTLLLN